jgi:ribose transport system ATP-binding protein
VRFQTPGDARRHGIAMIFQEFSLVPTLSVAQNVFLIRELRTRLALMERLKHRGMAIVDITRQRADPGRARHQPAAHRARGDHRRRGGARAA